MRSTRSIVPAVLVLTVLVAPRASSQNLSDALRVSSQGTQFNARALGMGNAYSTIGYDFAALRFNPATMAVNNRSSWSVTVNADGFTSRSNYYGRRVDFATHNMTGGQTGLTLPVRIDSTRSVVLGLGYTQSKDFNLGYKFEGLNAGTQFPSFIEVLADRADPTARALGISFPVYDGSGNFVEDRTVLGEGMFERGYLLGEGGLTHFTFGAALEAIGNVYVGASGSYNTGHYTSDLELAALDVNDVFPDSVETVPGDPATRGFAGVDYRVVRDRQYRGWDARFGIMYRLLNLVGLSTSFKLPSSHKVTEDAFFNGISRFAGNTSLAVPETHTRSSYRFRPPPELTVGAMVNPWLVTATAEVTYVDYTTMSITEEAGTLPSRTALNKRIKDELASVLNVNVGAEVRLPLTGLRGRVGGIYQPSPFKADPSRFAQKVLTLGAGYNSYDTVEFDLAYAYGWRGENEDLQDGDAGITDQNIGRHTVLVTIRLAF
jgi:hypothetical protein